MEDNDGGDGGGSPGDGSETKFSASITVPGNSAILDDGSGAELDDVDIDGGYSMPKLLEELTRDQCFGGFQEPIVWSRHEDENQECNVVGDEERVEEGLRTELQAAAGENHSVPPQGNVDTTTMDNEDVFTDDDTFFADLQVKAEAYAQEAGIMNQSEEPLEVEPIFCVDTAAPQIAVDDSADVEPDNVFERENLRFKVNASFPTMEDFRLALRQYGIVRGFKVHKVKTDKTRYRAECKAEGCPWRIVARKLRDQPTVVISMIPEEHNCVSTSKLGNSMASQKWVAEKIIGWLRKNPALGAKELQQKLLEGHSVEVGFSTVWAGKQKAINKIFGFWRDSFQALYNFRADLLSRSPGSVLEISTVIQGDGVHFDKLFMALQPCVDGFKNGCRPHLEIDSIALNGMYSGHLACACALDGHNWMYPVAWAIFGYESEDNWTWFIEELKKAIGNLPALEISTDGCKGYGNNNVPEGFNECVMNIKNMYLVDLVDRLRQMVMVLWYKRRKIGNKLSGNILPAIIQQLNEKTFCLGNLKVWKGGYQTGEVFGNFQDMTPWRHVVDLNTHTCSCGEWQLTGLPCLHALALISTETNVDLESFVHEYYSVERFKAAYSGIIPPMPDISQWPKVDTGFKLLPPPLKRGTSKRKYMRKAGHEPCGSKQHECMQSGELGHCENGCTLHGSVKRKRDQAEANKGQGGVH
ncbi:hypothetical protein QOZ80_5AG0393880 [Eleusine coracana subsp. coracana]|nr:hypothetical protein QOZ80_5AG0393880 [Eleusine coracana subsp. coracana]